MGHKGRGARVIDQHVELSEMLHRGRHKPLTVGLLRDIRLYRQRLSASTRDLLDNGFRRLGRPAVVHHHPGAHIGKLGRQRRAHA